MNPDEPFDVPVAQSPHPKDVLYREAYDPATEEWFGLLAAAELPSTEGQHLLARVLRANDLFHDLVDDVMHARSPAIAHALDVVAEYASSVVWAGQNVPPAAATAGDIEFSFRHKLKRNISLAMQEGLLVLESAHAFLETLGMRGEEARRAMERSYRLVGGLASVHDEREIALLKRLRRRGDEVSYPQVSFARILQGEFRIPADNFMAVDRRGGRSVAFVKVDLPHVNLHSPTMVCPAHRLRRDGRRLNETFWELLVNVFYGPTGSTYSGKLREDRSSPTQRP